MAFDTAKRGRLGRDLVALDAVGRPVQVLVRPGKGSWRNLRQRSLVGHPGSTGKQNQATHPRQKSESASTHPGISRQVTDSRNQYLQRLAHQPILALRHVIFIHCS